MGTRFLFVAVLALVAVGCGHSGGGSPVEPGATPEMPLSVSGETASTTQANRYLWGLWKVRIDADRTSAEVIPQRVAEMHLNAVRLLEVQPCTTCLRIDNIQAPSPNELSADVTLRHPYPGLLKYTAFDVRGVFIAGSDYEFPVSGRRIAWSAGSLPAMLNADGYTSLFNPTEFPETAPPALGYIRGKRATGGDLSATLNPFVAYAKDAPRRMFEAGSAQTKTVRLRVPDGPLEFGYAVDACWQLVEGEVTDPVNDFPPDANCLEAYRLDIEIGPGLGQDAMTSAPIHVEVFDHQGLDTIASVTVEAPELFGGESGLSFSVVTGEESFRFTGTIANDLGAEIGEYPLLVRVVDTETDQNLGVVVGWHVYSVGVAIRKGWAQTWGGIEADYGWKVAVDDSGNIYVTGDFDDTVDFDPWAGVEEHTSKGERDVFLSKFDSNGAFQWARTWGGDIWDVGQALVVDALGNAYVSGYFEAVVDFDPGPGTDERESNGSRDVFLSKFDTNGEFVWVRTWGGGFTDQGWSVTMDSSGSVYVTGSFMDGVDFDPGPGTDDHLSNGFLDVFLSKFDSSGNFNWARTWGGGGSWTSGHRVRVDALRNIYVVGSFRLYVDFDPGGGTEGRFSNGSDDVFLSKFDSAGSFQWVRTWGGLDSDSGHDLAIDGLGNAYVTGSFRSDTVDFDPGPGTDEHLLNGEVDAYLSKLDSTGSFQWALTWGGSDHDGSLGVAADGFGNVYTLGSFGGAVDFDPGPGTEERFSNEGDDAFLSKFDSTGSFQWVRTWGGEDRVSGRKLAADSLGNIYATGFFHGSVDFDPGQGIDEHTSNGSADVFLSKFPPDGNWW